MEARRSRGARRHRARHAGFNLHARVARRAGARIRPARRSRMVVGQRAGDLRRGQGAARRDPDLLPLVRPPSTATRAPGAWVRADAGLAAGRRRRARGRAHPRPAGARVRCGDDAPVPAPVRRAAGGDRRRRAGAGVRGGEHRRRAVRVRAGAAHLFRGVGRVGGDRQRVGRLRVRGQGRGRRAAHPGRARRSASPASSIASTNRAGP